ncbi:hypothetical protein BsWGS_06161 [Bradybaena similaris]
MFPVGLHLYSLLQCPYMLLCRKVMSTSSPEVTSLESQHRNMHCCKIHLLLMISQNSLFWVVRLHAKVSQERAEKSCLYVKSLTIVGNGRESAHTNCPGQMKKKHSRNWMEPLVETCLYEIIQTQVKKENIAMTGWNLGRRHGYTKST